MARVGAATRGNIPMFVRVAAVCAALVNVALLILWGALEVLAGDGASPVDTVPSAILAMISGLATAQIVLWWESSERDHRRGYRVVVVLSLCIGGTIMGELLGQLWTLDGTPGSGTFADVLARDALALIATLAGVLLTGLVGAAAGLVIGLIEGLVLAFPLAAVLCACGDAR